jgi:hypothetical protein
MRGMMRDVEVHLMLKPSSEVNRGQAGALPNVIVIGAMKCGTSSMHEYLHAHPDIAMSREKELNFFSHDDRWKLGPDWYRRHFSASTIIRGESSPSYTNFPRLPNVPERMKSLVPDAKLIYLVRDPIERVVSHYVHSREAGREKRPIDDALHQLEGNKYIEPSRYSAQLARYVRLFPASQILVISMEEMRDDRDETLGRVFRFLGVDGSFRSARHESAYHVSRQRGPLRRAIERNRLARKIRPYVPSSVVSWMAAHDHARPPIERPILSPPLREALRTYLRDDVNRLRAEFGQEFAKWSV